VTAIIVSDIDTNQRIGNASFDHPFTNAGDGFYDVTFDTDHGDYRAYVTAPGYESTWVDVRFTSFVVMTPSGGGNGGWFD